MTGFLSIVLDVFNFIEEHLLEVLRIINVRLSVFVVECFFFIYLQFYLVRSTRIHALLVTAQVFVQNIEALLSSSPIEWVKLEHLLQNDEEVAVILAILVTAILQYRFECPEPSLEFKLFIVFDCQFFEVVDCGGVCDEAGILQC